MISFSFSFDFPLIQFQLKQLPEEDSMCLKQWLFQKDITKSTKIQSFSAWLIRWTMINRDLGRKSLIQDFWVKSSKLTGQKKIQSLIGKNGPGSWELIQHTTQVHPDLHKKCFNMNAFCWNLHQNIWRGELSWFLFWKEKKISNLVQGIVKLQILTIYYVVWKRISKIFSLAFFQTIIEFT